MPTSLTRRQRIDIFLLWLKYDLRNFPGKIKRIVWNKWIMVRWNRLWIRNNEMHKSLDGDIEAMWEMDEQELTEYRSDLVRRRRIAHENDPDIAEWNEQLLADTKKRMARSGR